MNNVRIDLHAHSEHSMDGHYSVQEMVQAAIEMGLRIFAITDHCDINGYEDYLLAETVPASFASIQEAKQLNHKDILLLAGLELGQPLEDPLLAQTILEQHPFDFILGSVHNVRGREDFAFIGANNQDLDLDYELELYFKELLETIAWGNFDSAAHISYPFRYFQNNPLVFKNINRWDDHFDTIVRALADKGLGLELNTSGLKSNPPYTLPEEKWLRRYREHGGEILTLGSDAHQLLHVGSGIAEGIEIAKRAGFSYLAYFIQRKPYFEPINSR